MPTIFDAPLIISLGFLGVRTFWKDRRTHLLGGAGWVLFGIFWWTQLPGYVDHSDTFNSFVALFALPVFGYFGYHEYLSYKWYDEYRPLRFIAGATFLAATIYFLVEKTPQLSGPLIKVVSDHSIGILNALGHNYTTLEPQSIMGELSVPIVPSTVRMVLACTALQGMTVAGSFILLGWESWKRKAAVLALVLVSTYIINLGRNALVIYLCDMQGMTFNLAHGVIGKSISLVTLIILVVIAFVLLPSLYENIVGILDLPWRKGPNHQYEDRIFGTKFSHEEEAKTDLTKEED